MVVIIIQSGWESVSLKSKLMVLNQKIVGSIFGFKLSLWHGHRSPGSYVHEWWKDGPTNQGFVCSKNDIIPVSCSKTEYKSKYNALDLLLYLHSIPYQLSLDVDQDQNNKILDTRGSVGRAVASLWEGCRIEFVCSLCAYVGFLQIPWFPTTDQKHAR